MSTGIFATTFSQVGVIGLYPFRFLFNNLTTTRLSLFTQLANLPWNVKIFAGLVADSFPILGTRRRLYLLFSAAAAALLWLAVGITRPLYWPLLGMAILMNLALVFASTVSGGLLVEAGQEHGATGRLSSLRVVSMNIAAFGVPLGALLAGRALGETALIAAVPLILLTFITAWLLREPPTARRDPRICGALSGQLRACFRSRMLWAAAGLLFLVQFAPGLSTPLFKYQTKTLGFGEGFIGLLTLIDALFGTLGALFYSYFCQRWPLRLLLYLSIGSTAALSMIYMGYNGRKSAIAIEMVYSFWVYLAQLPLFDLAARATPKGSEALGYSIIISAWNWGLSVSDPLGSFLFDKAGKYLGMAAAFKHLVWINAATTALVLIAIPFLPRVLVDRREQEA